MIRAIASVCISVAAFAAVPGIAAAEQTSGSSYKTAEFKAKVKGSQVTTWTFNRPYDENNPCVAPGSGYGDSSVYFENKSPMRLQVAQAPKDNPNLFSTRGRPLVLAIPTPARLDARAERDTDVNYGAIDEKKCEGPNGGGVIPDPRPKDCGVRTGTIGVRFFYDWRSILDDAIPSDNVKRDRNQLKLETYDPQYQGSPSGDLEDAYQNCELEQATTAEHRGTTYVTGGKLVEKKLFQTKRKKIKVSGSLVTPIKGQYYTGKTILAWNLTLTRVK